MREIEASPGFAIDANGYDVSVESDVTATLKVQEVPQNNPIDIVLQKIDSETQKNEPQGAASLEHAEFTVKYFKEQMDSNPEEAGKTAERTWVFQTDQELSLIHI